MSRWSGESPREPSASSSSSSPPARFSGGFGNSACWRLAGASHEEPGGPRRDGKGLARLWPAGWQQLRGSVALAGAAPVPPPPPRGALALIPAPPGGYKSLSLGEPAGYPVTPAPKHPPRGAVPVSHAGSLLRALGRLWGKSKFTGGDALWVMVLGQRAGSSRGRKKASLVARCPTRRRSSRNQALGWDGGWEGVRTGSYPYSAFAPNPLPGKDWPCPLLALARPRFFVLLLLYLSAFPALALTFHFPVPSAARGSVLSPPAASSLAALGPGRGAPWAGGEAGSPPWGAPLGRGVALGGSPGDPRPRVAPLWAELPRLSCVAADAFITSQLRSPSGAGPAGAGRVTDPACTFSMAKLFSGGLILFLPWHFQGERHQRLRG